MKYGFPKAKTQKVYNCFISMYNFTGIQLFHILKVEFFVYKYYKVKLPLKKIL